MISPDESYELDEFVLNAQPELQPLLTSAVTLGADLQRKKIQEDTKAGLARARAQGKQIGRKRVEVDWEKIEYWKKKGLSERAAAIVCGYRLSTFYKRKKERRSSEIAHTRPDSQSNGIVGQNQAPSQTP